MSYFFFFQAEDGIRDLTVTGVQTCALPIATRYGRCRIGRGRGRPPPACRSRQKSTWDGRSYNGAGLLRGRLGRGVRSAVRGDSLQLRVEGPRPLLLREMVEASLGVRRPPP